MKFRNLVIALLFGSVALVESGCASIFSKSKYSVTIRTNAHDATVNVKDFNTRMPIASGKAPLTIQLKAHRGFFDGASYHCEAVSKDGKMNYVIVNSGVDYWTFGNFIIGGIIGLAIDGASGAFFRLDEDVYIYFPEYGPLPAAVVPQPENNENKAGEKSTVKPTDSKAPAPSSAPAPAK